MRKNLIALATTVLLLGVLFPLEAEAQLSVGVRGGLVSAHLGGDIDYNSHKGLYAGAFGAIAVNELLSLRPEVAYVQKGSSDEILRASPGGTTIVRRRNRLTYIEVMLPLTFTPRVESERVKPRLYAAPAVAFEQGCTTEFENAPELTGSYDCDETIAVLDALAFTRTKSYDYGLVLGAGVDVGAGRARFTADIRYDIGLADIQDLAGGAGIKNRALEFLVGLSYQLTS